MVTTRDLAVWKFVLCNIHDEFLHYQLKINVMNPLCMRERGKYSSLRVSV